MLVIIKSKTELLHKKIYPSSISKIIISLFSGFISVDNQHIKADGIELYFPNKNKLINDKCIFVYNTDEYELVVINDLDSYYKFDYYSYQFPISIGEATLNDIVVEGCEDLIFDHNYLSRALFVNDVYANTFRAGDVITINQLIIIISNEFIMVNSKYDDINLNHYIPSKLSKIESLTIDYNLGYKLNKSLTKLDYKLPKLVSFKTYEPQSLLTSIGPGLTMAFASFGLALFNSFESIKQGKSIERIIPSFIFPLAILISLLFWQPLSRYLEKRRIKAINLDIYRTYEIKLDKLENRIKQDIQAYNNYYKQLSFTQEPYSLSKYHSAYNDLVVLEICPYPLININKIEDDDSDLIVESNNFIDYMKKQQGPLVFKFDVDNMITIVAIVELMILLILQYVYHRNYQELKCVVIGDYTLIEDLLKLKHFYHNHKKLVFKTYSEFVSYEDYLRDLKLLVILIGVKCPQLRKEYRIIRYYSHLKDIEMDTKYVISSNELYYDNKLFSISHHSYDYKSILSKLLRYNIIDNSVNINSRTSFFQLYCINELSSSMLLKRWLKSSLDINLGYNDDQDKEGIDLHETKDGPHGLIAGTTGSGKSELIITLLLGLIYQNDYQRLHIIIIDFKGNNIASLFNGFPHVIGTISNLDLRLIDRLIISLKNECHQRELMFANMTSILNTPIQNIDDYNQYYKKIEDYKLMASLVIVIDEFAELKRLCPLFIEELISLARIGRSLGLHLIMATQKPSGVVDSQIWSNMQFKICLKVMDKQDSTEMIDDTEAYYINEAGRFILKSKRKRTIAKAVLSTTSIIDSNSHNEVKVYYDNGIVKKNELKKDSFNSQIQAIKNLCVDIQNKRKDIRKYLWLNPLKAKNIKDLTTKYPNTKELIIGEFDDISNQSQGLMVTNQYPSLFITSSENVVSDIVNRLLQAASYLEKEVIVVDSNLDNYTDINDYIHILDTNILGNIEKFIEQELSNYLVIIRDIASFRVNDNYLKGLLKQLSKSNNIILVSTRINLATSIINHVKEVFYVAMDKHEYGGSYKLAKDEASKNDTLIKLIEVDSIKFNNKLKNKMYLNYPIKQKCYKNKWLIGYNRYSLEPVYLPYEIKLVILGAYSERFNRSIINKLSKNSKIEVLIWIDNDYPGIPFDPIKLTNSSIEGLMYYENKTMHLYLANE